MPNIDIPVPKEVEKLFTLPDCFMIKLPSPQPAKIQLPTGGSIQAFADISKGVPNDCAMTFSLLVQLSPFLAATECLLKLLGLIAPLIDVVKALGPPPNPFKLGEAIPKFIKAAEKLLPCVLVVSGAPLIPFLRDLLCLIIKVLNCLVGQLKSVLGVLNGIALQFQTAQAENNTELLDNLKCAKENAELQAQHLTAAIEPVGMILDLASTIFELTGQEPIKLPAIGSQTDIEGLQQLVQTLQGIIGTLQIVADALGGCE